LHKTGISRVEKTTGTGALGDWHAKVFFRGKLMEIFKCGVHVLTRATRRKNEMMIETRSWRP